MEREEIQSMIDQAKKDNPTLEQVHGLMDLAYQDGIKEKEGYAKQDAIGFADFIKYNHYNKSEGKGWYKYFEERTDLPSGVVMSTPVYTYHTTEELYTLYLESKK